MRKAGLSVLLALSLMGSSQSLRLRQKSGDAPAGIDLATVQAGETIFSGNVQMMCMTAKQSGKAGHLSLNCELQQSKPEDKKPAAAALPQTAAAGSAAKPAPATGAPAQVAAVQSKSPPAAIPTPGASAPKMT